MINRRVDGLILMPASHDQSYLQAQIQAGFAVVIIDRPADNLVTDTVTVDNEGGARQATAHLISHGHRRIAVITDEHRVLTAQVRFLGYRQACQAAGLAVDPALVRTARTKHEAAAALADLLRQPDPPTAVFTARNTVTEGAIAALQQAGLSHHVALVGFDDLPSADLIDPAITVVRQDTFEVGRRATHLLLQRLDPDPVLPQQVVIPTEFVRRGSGEIRPA